MMSLGDTNKDKILDGGVYSTNNFWYPFSSDGSNPLQSYLQDDLAFTPRNKYKLEFKWIY